MANVDGAFGFRQVGGLGSRPTSEGTSKYVIQSGTTGAIYAGDVMTAGNGTTISEGGGVLAYGYVGSSETDAVRNVGIFNGCFYDDPTTSKPTFKNYWPGDLTITNPSAGATAFVYDNPDDLFEVQTSGTLTQVIASRGIDSAYTAGSTINGRSKEEITATAKSGGQFAVVRISGDPANSDTGNANSNWIVKFNKHVYYDYSAT
jgi:hypothetical protein